MPTRHLFWIEGLICLVFVITCAAALYFGDHKWPTTSPTSKSVASSQPSPAAEGSY
jgi:hypothetical protein